MIYVKNIKTKEICNLSGNGEEFFRYNKRKDFEPATFEDYNKYQKSISPYTEIATLKDKLSRRNKLVTDLRGRIKKLKEAVALGLREDQIANS